MFTVLPFGLSSAPYIFTKVVRVLVRYWRSHAVRITVYLNDGLGSARDFAAAKLLHYLLRLRFSFLDSFPMIVNQFGSQLLA